jgi:pimeloyl-ACP methyl ester carboxylesterase
MRLVSSIIVLALALGFGGPQAGAAGFAPAPPARTLSVRSPDGVNIVVYEWGNPAGRPIVFVHGSYQSALSWSHQVSDPTLAARYRLIAIDLRGHGASDKPDGAEYYREGKRWADDLTH